MRFIDKIKKKLTEEEFSFELLNYCKDEFQHGGFDENDKAVYIRQAIFKEYRGNKEKRYGTLLLNEITDYIFSNYPMVHYIKARIHHDYISSMKMAWNCGFKNDGEIFSK